MEAHRPKRDALNQFSFASTEESNNNNGDHTHSIVVRCCSRHNEIADMMHSLDKKSTFCY